VLGPAAQAGVTLWTLNLRKEIKETVATVGVPTVLFFGLFYFLP
jgi:hypothetical protein